MKNRSVCILGATGVLGQEYLRLLSEHPYLKIRSVCGRKNVGKKLSECIDGADGTSKLPASLLELEILPSEPKAIDAELVFSPLPNEEALLLEPKFASAGLCVVTDAAPHRLDQTVPLLVPEVNPESIGRLDRRHAGGAEGFIVATPNCTATGMVLTLKPLEKFGIKNVVATTMQAVSGAGYPGVPSLDIIDNVIPHIPSEEEKIDMEINKILSRTDSPIRFSVTATRVPVLNGHTVSMHVEFEQVCDVEDVRQSVVNFRGRPQELGLPTAPKIPLVLFDETDRPQPRFDRECGSVPGMAVAIGRLRRGLNDRAVHYVEVSNNKVRGGAGGAVLAAELLCAEGVV